jgi:hypothetical protein
LSELDKSYGGALRCFGTNSHNEFRGFFTNIKFARMGGVTKIN